jgi:hypothetical protein
VAGPKRPPRKEKARRKPSIPVDAMAGSSTARSQPTRSASIFSAISGSSRDGDGGGGRTAHTTTRTSADVRQSTYTGRQSALEAKEALEERGERLGFLSETLDDLGKASKDMVKEAKNMAFKTSAKKRFESLF